MTVVLIADKETSPHTSSISRTVATRNVAVQQIVYQRDDQAPASLVTANDRTFAARLRLVLDDLSRAMTGAYAITPSFGRLQTQTPWSGGEQHEYVAAEDQTRTSTPKPT